MLLTVQLVSRKDKHNLYYLFPGMGRGARKRFLRNFFIAVFVGLLVSGGWAVLWYLTYR
jgi:hypothetical protein